MNEPYYFREERYEYKLRSHPSYGFYVGRSNNGQAIWGLGEDWIDIIWFDLAGNFERFEKIAFIDFIKAEGFQSDILFEKANNFIYQRFNLIDETVSLKRFWLEEIETGIEDLTETMKEFLSEPDAFDDEETIEYKEILEEWKNEGQYVFWWGQDFYVNKDGFVETS